jgi:hypothetical protein
MSRRLLVPSDPSRQWFHIAALALILLFAARTVYFLVKGSSTYLFFVTDDFFYYLIPARNFVTTSRFTFDGLTLTNGFHPLWMLCTVLLWAISFGSTKLFFLLLTVVLSASAYITLRLLEGLLTDLKLDSRLSPVFVGLTFLVTTGLIFIGMEITLTIPLYLLFIRSIIRYKGRIKDDYVLGAVTVLLILSRLETAILLCPVLWLMLYRKSFPSAVRSFARLSMMLIPIVTYVAMNVWYFGTPLPVSSLAKQLVDPSFRFNQGIIPHLLFERDGMGALLLLPVALVLVLRTWRQKPFSERMGIAILLWYPIVFLTLFGLTSDWIVFRWYFYPLPILFIFCASLLANRITFLSDKIGRGVYVVVSIGIVAFGVWNFYRQTIRFSPEPNSVFQHAALLQPFVASHPGLYAMGDRAGLTAFMCNMPVIQLEGLSSGLSMIDSIRKQADLLALLHHYGVKYLIESRDSTVRENGGNFMIASPQVCVAGQHSLAMHATLSQRPVFHIATSSVWGWDTSQDRLGEVNTYVFELH